MFSEYAPKYWAAGLPAMPLRPRSKMPALNAWQSYCLTMPTEDAQAAWLKAYPENNIGLPLGPCSGVVAVDLDSEDPRVLAILERLMPKTAWTRVGKKGAVYAFRYNGERSYRIRDENNKTILEVLSRGTQIVLPPSIHPDTGQPYVADANLWEVKDQLVPLPNNFEVAVRTALLDAGFKLTSRSSVKLTEWVPSGGRDSMMIANAGLLAKSVVRGENTLLEAINMIETWVVTYTEHVIGDAMSPEKGREKLMEFLRRDVVDSKKQLPPGWDAGLEAEEIVKIRQYLGDVGEQWDQTQCVAFLTERFTTLSRDDVPGLTQAIDTVLMQMHQSAVISETEREVILRFIGKTCGHLISMASLRKRLRELGTENDMTGADHTEIAKHLINELERYGEVRYSAGSLYQWRGSHWERLTEGEVLRVLSEEFGHLPAARKHNDHKGILKTAFVLVPQRLTDAFEEPGINFANGFLTTDLELKEHHPRWGCTYVLPYRYVPEGSPPIRWLSLLDQNWGEDPDYEDKVMALREYIAATLFGITSRFQKVMCLFGVPHTGKSVVMDTVIGLIPGAAFCNVPPQEWGDKFLPAQMYGKLINACGDLSESQSVPGHLFKQIVNGDEIMGQHKGSQIFPFRPTCAHWFCTNHLPRSRDTSAGFTRRWLFLEFKHKVPVEGKITRYHEQILAEEREAIAAWAVGGIESLLRRQDYCTPASHHHLVNQVANQNNSARYFMTSGLVDYVADGQVSEGDLYASYYAFCKTVANMNPVALKRFRLIQMELESELGFKIQVTGHDTATYLGVALAKRKK